MGCDQETVRAAEKIILPGDRDRLGCVTQIRVRATCQRDEFSLCTSKFESDHPSHAVGLADVPKCNFFNEPGCGRPRFRCASERLRSRSRRCAEMQFLQ